MRHSRIFPLLGAMRGAGMASCNDRPFDYGTEALVPLTRDWPLLLHAARRFERLYLQTRHAHARLVVNTPVPRLARYDRPGCMIDAARAMHFNFDYWLRAWAVVRPCACCGSPGRVVIHNALGLEFMQLCAPSTCAVDEWADYVAAVALPRSDSSRANETRLPAIPCAPSHVRWASDAAETLAPLFAALAEEKIPVRATVRTTEAAHSRELIPFVRTVEAGLLVLGDARVVLQIALSAVWRVGIEPHHSGPLLRMAGRGGALIATISPADREPAATVWRAALRHAFPFFC